MAIQSTGGEMSGQPTTSNFTFSLASRFILAFVFMGALLFMPAGRLDWGPGWAVFGLHIVYFAIMIVMLRAKNPDLIGERSRLVTPDTKGWDKVITAASAPVFLGTWVVAGLDARFGWQPDVALGVQIAALGVVALGYTLVGWAMVVNRYFSRVVRIQEERGHRVVTQGPYQYVRHPGYAGFIPAFLAMPVALGSAWALIPGGIAAGVLVVRTALEDRTLQEELEGYEEYAGSVTSRLVPGIW